MIRSTQNLIFDTNANWVTYNPILLPNVIAVSSDTGGMKIGNGQDHWADINFTSGSYIGPIPVESGTPLTNEIPRCNGTQWVYTLQGFSDTETNIATNTTVYPSFTTIVELDDSTNIPTGRIKFGDGTTGLNNLPWSGGIHVYNEFSTGVEGESIVYKSGEWVPEQFWSFADFASPSPLNTDQYLRADLTWATPDVATTPSSVTNNGIVIWDGTDGKRLKDSAILITDIPSATGTPSNTYQIDNDANGPKLKHVSGELQFRDSTDTVYAPIQCSIIESEVATVTDKIVLNTHEIEDIGGYLTIDGAKIFTEATDGDSSGLNANYLQGFPAAYFEPATGNKAASYITCVTGGSILPPTYYTVQDYINIQGAGIISGGTITSNGDGSVTVAAGTGLIKTTSSLYTNTVFCEWATNATVSLTDNATNYIYLDYSTGIIVSTVNRNDLNLDLDITFGRVYRSGTAVYVINSGSKAYCITSRTHERLIKTDGGLSRASGGIISATGTRNIASSAGEFYIGLNQFTTAAKDTSVSDTFTYWYRNGTGGWTSVASQTQINNTQYDDGDGTLGTLNNNQYGVHFVYIDYDGNLHVLYGQGSYTLTNAENATIPSSIPPLLSNFAVLSAKIIILKSATAFTSITSAYTTAFPIGSPSNHNDLGGLQGGTTDQYYHLTAAEQAQVSASKFTQFAVGDSTNYLEVATTGTTTLHGSARTWEDLRVEPTARVSGTNTPSFEQWFTNGSASKGVYLYSFDDAVVASEKELHFTMQMPHNWARTAIHLHLHWIPYAAGSSQTVRWGLEYTWADVGSVFGNTTIIYVSTNEQGDTSLVQNKHYLSEFASISPSTSQDDVSSIMIGRLFRNSSNAADTFTNKAGLLYIDAHYEVDGFGSDTEYTK